MKILLVDYYMEYMNPTDKLTLEILVDIADELSIYGFGYVNFETLQKGLRNFIKENGPFDLIFTNERVLLSKNAQIWAEPSKRDIKKSFVSHFNLQTITEPIVNEIIDTLSFFSDKLIIFMLQTDFYNFRESSVKLLNDLPKSKIISFGKDLISQVNKCANLKYEKFFEHTQDNWYNFSVKNDKRICSIPHFISLSEIFWGQVSNRDYDLAIPGVDYYARKEVLKAAKNENINLAPSYTRKFNIANRIGINVYGSKLGIITSQTLFKQNIAKSKVAFTCGSALNWPLRKFFEIPAFGSVLICMPFKNAEQHGFIDNETCFMISNTSDFIPLFKEIISDTTALEKVATASRNMIIEMHTVKARKRSISKFLGI